jgi:hypothetical protein
MLKNFHPQRKITKSSPMDFCVSKVGNPFLLLSVGLYNLVNEPQMNINNDVGVKFHAMIFKRVMKKFTRNL